MAGIGGVFLREIHDPQEAAKALKSGHNLSDLVGGGGQCAFWVAPPDRDRPGLSHRQLTLDWSQASARSRDAMVHSEDFPHKHQCDHSDPTLTTHVWLPAAHRL